MRMYFWYVFAFTMGLEKWGHAAHHPHSAFGENYSYDVKDLQRGPTAWRGQCLRGSLQSPIDIRYKDHGVSWGYTKIWFNHLYQQNQKGFYFTNRGNTFQVQLNGNIREPTSDLSLSGAGRQHRYTFSQMHFHWGDRDEVGSEHTLQGQRYPMEIHMVHYKSKYDNLSHALQDNTQDDEAVVVLGILCELGSENIAFRPIVDAVRMKAMQDPSSKLMFTYHALNLYKLLPKHLDFVGYMGSLTTPPCTESVAWTVFQCPIQISMRQLEAFRNLHNADGEEYYNYRPLQKGNGRKLKYYKVADPPEQGSLQGGSTAIIKNTITTTLHEMNSLFSNILNILSEAKLCEMDELHKSVDKFRSKLINSTNNP